MFTGLVATVGRVASVTRVGGDFRLRVDATLPGEPLELGESIAVNGVCLTVMELSTAGFVAQASPETLRRSNLGDLGPRTPVNLERALRLADRLGGHLVLGHVDGVGALRSVRREANAIHVTVEVPRGLMPFVVDKGSIALDGVSLTVNALGEDELTVTIIPYTAANIALVDRPRGWRINLEVDVLGKYVARLLATGAAVQGTDASASGATPGVSLDLLRESGFIRGG